MYENEYGVLMELYRQRKTIVLGEKSLSVTLCHQKCHMDLSGIELLVSAVGGLRLSSCFLKPNVLLLSSSKVFHPSLLHSFVLRKLHFRVRRVTAAVERLPLCTSSAF